MHHVTRGLSQVGWLYDGILQWEPRTLWAPVLGSILRPVTVWGWCAGLGILGAGHHLVQPSLGFGGPQIASAINQARPGQYGTQLAGQALGDPDEDTFVAA